MKNQASVFLKRILSLVSSIAKAKSMAAKSKTSAIKTRLILCSLMKSKKVNLIGSISDKIHSILGHTSNNQDEVEDLSKAIVLYSNSNDCSSQIGYYYDDEDDDSKYPDLTHSLFDEEEEFINDPGGSIIDMVKNSKEGGGEDFSLENEIDHVADLFIMRFHKQMRLQKLQSFKRFQERLERSA